jgi:hypothetical protein
LGLPAYFIQYKFFFPKKTPHASYAYQKLFRGLYGYTQVVNKSSGKTYRYHRPGVLSFSPFLRPGKNSVVVPPSTLQSLLLFFKTGKNPAHHWVFKGEWKAVYYLNEKKISVEEGAHAFRVLFDRPLIRIGDTYKTLAKLVTENQERDLRAVFSPGFLGLGEKVTGNEWFEACMLEFPLLRDFKAVWLECKKQGKNP